MTARRATRRGLQAKEPRPLRQGHRTGIEFEAGFAAVAAPRARMKWGVLSRAHGGPHLEPDQLSGALLPSGRGPLSPHAATPGAGDWGGGGLLRGQWPH